MGLPHRTSRSGQIMPAIQLHQKDWSLVFLQFAVHNGQLLTSPCGPASCVQTGLLADLSNRVQIPNPLPNTNRARRGPIFLWRRGWDSNPRRAINPCWFSRPVHSTALPPLRGALLFHTWESHQMHIRHCVPFNALLRNGIICEDTASQQPLPTGICNE